MEKMKNIDTYQDVDNLVFKLNTNKFINIKFSSNISFTVSYPLLYTKLHFRYSFPRNNSSMFFSFIYLLI